MKKEKELAISQANRGIKTNDSLYANNKIYPNFIGENFDALDEFLIECTSIRQGKKIKKFLKSQGIFIPPNWTFDSIGDFYGVRRDKDPQFGNNERIILFGGRDIVLNHLSSYNYPIITLPEDDTLPFWMWVLNKLLSYKRNVLAINNSSHIAISNGETRKNDYDTWQFVGNAKNKKKVLT